MSKQALDKNVSSRNANGKKTGNLYSDESKAVSHTIKNISKSLMKTSNFEYDEKNINKIVQDIGISKGFLEKTPIAQKLISRNLCQFFYCAVTNSAINQWLNLVAL